MGATIAVDASGMSRPGVIPGSGVSLAATGLAGDADTAVKVSASGIYRVDESWMVATTITVEAIIFMSPSDSYASYHCVVSLDGGASARGWNIYIRDGKPLLFNPSDGNDVIVGPSVLASGVKHHIAYVATSGSQSLYVDGAVVGSVARSMPAYPGAPGNRMLKVGTSSAGVSFANNSFPFGANGILDEVAVYTSALSAARILAHAQACGAA
ncbi:LamG-like jellyroll fold domain-containing protein [Microbacterium jejuense]|uniref:LamG-like jellyroll fold domain-containing protein n=1 Tax=Microbacterium jejuense TaxID=1263637 RepID=UPI0031ECAB0E